jgi:transposase
MCAKRSKSQKWSPIFRQTTVYVSTFIKKEHLHEQWKYKSFRSYFKAKVALEAIHGVKHLTRLSGIRCLPSSSPRLVEERVTGAGASLFDTKRGPKPVDPIEDPEPQLYS